MGAGIWIEPLVVVTLLFGGAWINRARPQTIPSAVLSAWGRHKRSDDSLESGSSSPQTEDGLLSRSFSWGVDQRNGWRTRTIALFGVRKETRSPDTSVFSDRILSRILKRFPFLVEVWYWALIYWVYQLGRALTAVTLVQGTVHTARQHALQLIHLEQALGMFWEPAIQRFFLQCPALMHWTNRIYSFIHIPGTILFLIGLFYLTVTANRSPGKAIERSPAGPALYKARRRTMAMSNLIAFVIFTTWPCMPPRLLSDPGYEGADAEEAKGYGFVDTVHGPDGESSIWTQNKFCNPFAAMPSLHFGYSLLIGVTVALLPLASQTRTLGFCGFRVPSVRRMVCVLLGIAYPSVILLAIIATANHFILDAVAGALVCAIAWKTERFLLNLLPLEDWFLWGVRTHKPSMDVDSREELQGLK